jgi:uncharacterized protein YbbC (DUF1343 family)
MQATSLADAATGTTTRFIILDRPNPLGGLEFAGPGMWCVSREGCRYVLGQSVTVTLTSNFTRVITNLPI